MRLGTNRRNSGRGVQWLLSATAVAVLCLGREAHAQTYTYVDEPYVPTASEYGGVGLLDMRNARFLPDGYVMAAGTIKMPDDRVALTFQALPWLETTFRYAINYALPPAGQRALYDRSFDLKARLFQEGDYTPQIAVGLQDFIGTGVYSGEYLVASKDAGPLDFTLGMGWGRLASRPSFSNPLGLLDSRFYYRPVDTSPTGGLPILDFFRGKNVGLFGGIEYQTPIPKLTLKVEYSSDDYAEESATQKTNYARIPVNAGLSYRFWSNVDVGVAYMYGRELAINVSIFMDPTRPIWPDRLDEQPPFTPRAKPDIQAAQTAIQIASGNEGDEPWRVHFVDLTAPGVTPDGRPADPAMSSAAAGQRVGQLLQDAGLHVTEDWIEGRTLVVQVDGKQPSAVSSVCQSLTGEARSIPGVQEIAFVSGDWNPIEFCDGVAAQPSQSIPVAAQISSFASHSGPDSIRQMRAAIEQQRVGVEGIVISGNTVNVEIENNHFLRDAEAISRTLRALSATAPADITSVRVTTSIDEMPLTTVTMSRSEVDALADRSATPAEVWADSVFSDARPSTGYDNGRGYPRFTWSLFPSLEEDLFDPNNPVYFGVGISGSTSLKLLPGLVLDDEATYSAYNNFGSITRGSNSVLPHVRSDIALYLKRGASGIDDVTLSYYSKLAPNLYGRVTGGYIETMFGGAGGELLYREQNAPWAIGGDVFDVYQRNFDDLFGFQNYHVVTGHVSVYLETPWYDITAVWRAGRYLAGDYGGTFELYRRFDTGVLIGGWFTLTNVPFSKFGEGSFDKGIRIVIPLEWSLPIGSTTNYEMDLRPIQRDGGQPLENDAILYDMTQSSNEGDLQRQWSDVLQ